MTSAFITAMVPDAVVGVAADAIDDVVLHSEPSMSSLPFFSIARWALAPLACAVVLATLACNDLSGLAGKQQLPAGTPDPSVYRSAAGAMALYQTTLAAFQATNGVSNVSIGGTGTNASPGIFVHFVLVSGLLTDELQVATLGCFNNRCLDSLDARILPEGAAAPNVAGSYFSADAYTDLQRLRNDAILGIGALATYDSAASPALQGHLHALLGYAEVMLADLYCSGVPLSTLNFSGATSYTYAASSTTAQVYQAAVAEFDTALALSTDSARLENLAWVGKARALLALDSVDAAATAAANVPDGYKYQFLVNWGLDRGNRQLIFGNESDNEGLNGLPYISSGDPRTTAQQVSNAIEPIKYGGAAAPGILPITVGDWVEARLIQAEAALRHNDPSWLTLLNTLRKTAHVTGQPDTLATLSDPGATLSGADADSARVNLLFRERAYWLYLTGHREGDLRRLIRQYGRTKAQVYPFGSYSGLHQYGSYVEIPIPSTEMNNPLFHRCLARGA